MRVQYCSDLHIEFIENDKFLNNSGIEIAAPILILAGDIAPLHDVYLNNQFFRFLSNNYNQVFWVPGNHEFYHRNITDYGSSFNIKITDNINIVNNIDFIYEGVRFIFSTLWSHIQASKAKLLEQSISDFSLIRVNNKKLKTSNFNQLHQTSIQFIKKALEVEHNKTIVVTHHLPSSHCNSPIHSKSPINEAFCVELTEFIEKCNANFWIYGHSHFNQKPLIIGKTLLLTNQLGYVHLNEHKLFKSNAYFVI